MANDYITHNINIPKKLTSNQLVEVIATAKEIKNSYRNRTYSGGFIIVLDQEVIELSWDNKGKPYISIISKEQHQQKDIKVFRTIIDQDGNINVDWDSPLEFPNPVVEDRRDKPTKLKREKSPAKTSEQPVDPQPRKRGRPRKQVD